MDSAIFWLYAIQEYVCLYLPAGTTEETPSQLSTFTEQEQEMTDLEKLTIQLQSVTYEEIELREILDIYIKKDLNNRLKSLEMLKKEHKEVMSDLQKLPIEISEALNKSKQLIEENESYVFLNSLVLQDLTPLKKDTHALRLENKKLLEEQISLQESCEEVKKLFKEVLEIICDPCAEQHQHVHGRVLEQIPSLVVQSAAFPESTAGVVTSLLRTDIRAEVILYALSPVENFLGVDHGSLSFT
ncbi:putative gene 21977 [Cricetulus griseus]